MDRPSNVVTSGAATEQPFARVSTEDEEPNRECIDVQVMNMLRYRMQHWLLLNLLVPASTCTRIFAVSSGAGRMPLVARTCKIHPCFVIDYITDVGDISSVLSPPPSASAGITPDASQLIVTTGRIKPQ